MKKASNNLFFRIFVSITLCFSSISLLSAAPIQPGTEYYLWLNIYEKLLGSNSEGTAPALSAFSVNSDK